MAFPVLIPLHTSSFPSQYLTSLYRPRLLRFRPLHDRAGTTTRCPRARRCVPLETRTSPAAPPPLQRRTANYQPSIWDDEFIQSLKSDYLSEGHTARLQELKENVRRRLTGCCCGVAVEACVAAARLELVDVLCRLGVGYHFEEEIDSVLRTMLPTDAGDVSSLLQQEGDLHHTALLFRLLREHGFKVSQDLFYNFRDADGSFSANFCHDLEGMLSLYEASYLAVEGEDILDEAKAFTTKHLKINLINEGDMMNPILKERVAHALELPLNWRMLRLETWWFIRMYEREVNVRDPTLLELAKLDFNVAQSAHRRDIREMSRWWKNLGLTNNLSFARDRIMENFLWTVGVISEPQFWYFRQSYTKINCFITTIDDVYDVYGSLDELELFTDAVERWDTNTMERLPQYMKICFLALFNTINEMAYIFLKEEGLDITPYLKKTWADLCKSYLLEARWYHNQGMPTFKEYMDNAWISISAPLILLHGYVFLRHDAKKEALLRLESYPNVIRWSSTILRLCDDLGTSTAELERGDVPKSIQCYMNEKNVSETVAREHIRGLIDETWSKMNTERFVSGTLEHPKSFISIAANLARMSQCMYQHGDGHGIPDQETKERVLSLLITPI